jgi:hypothetical protein
MPLAEGAGVSQQVGDFRFVFWHFQLLWDLTRQLIVYSLSNRQTLCHAHQAFVLTLGHCRIKNRFTPIHLPAQSGFLFRGWP